MHEFQAVVLAAGRGSRMTELTCDKPKCLLPVGDKPILCHALHTLERAGINDVLVLVMESDLVPIQQALQQKNIKSNYELVAIPVGMNDDWGTADSVRYLMKENKIRRDIILMSCDLFTNTNIKKLLHSYQKHRAIFAALFFLPYSASSIVVPGLKSKFKPERDVVGIDTETSRLVFLASASDFEENIRINESILRRHTKVSLRSDLLDGHLYVMSFGLAQYLTGEMSMSTLKGEFFPYIVNKQSCRPNAGNEESSVVDESMKNSVFEYVKQTKLDENILQSSTYNDHQGDLKSAYLGDTLRCYAVIADGQDFGIRINSLLYLCQANEMYIQNNDSRDSTHKKIDPTAVVRTNQVDEFSFIGAGAKVDEKISIKSSTVGENCIIRSKTRISKCIIMKNVHINEGCNLENCIISDDATIGPGCELKNCLIGAQFTVPDNTKSVCQVFSKSSGLMEI